MDGPIVRLTGGDTAVVGYGSLLSAEDVTRAIHRQNSGVFLLCHIAGWRRSWDVSMPNRAFYYEEAGKRVYPERILYLNVRPEDAALMNCALFVVGPRELEQLHDREWIYDHPVVTDHLRGVTVEGGDAIMYVGRPEHRVSGAVSPREAAVRSSYLQMLDEALARTHASFRAEHGRTTDPVPGHLVVQDFLDPERPDPWKSAGRAYAPQSRPPRRRG